MNRAFRPNETSRPGFKAGLGGFARLTLFGAASSLALALGSTAYALPGGGSVAAGAATLSSGANTLTVNQSSQNAVLNWQSFSIAQGESVRFNQPNTGSVALNRVTGSDPSSILGSLSANGKVFLVNPNGILFGANAQVNVGGLVASTLNISDADFMAGKYSFSGPGGGTVLNQGSINANGAGLALHHFGHAAGMASALIGIFLYGGATLASAAMGAFVTPTSPVPMAGLMALFGLSGVATYLLFRPRAPG